MTSVSEHSLIEAKILIVDDNMNNVDVLIKSLKTEKYDVSVATSGEMALDNIKQNSPNLILLDIMLPGIDGFEVCKLIKANPATSYIPIIF